MVLGAIVVFVVMVLGAIVVSSSVSPWLFGVIVIIIVVGTYLKKNMKEFTPVSLVFYVAIAPAVQIVGNDIFISLFFVCFYSQYSP